MRQVSSCVTNNKNLRQISVEFTSKAKPRSVKVRKTYDHHQVDSENKKSMKVERKGKCNRYLFF